MHEYIETGYTAKIAAQRNVSKYKTNAYYRPPEPKRCSIQREERGYLAPEVNGTRILCWIMTTPDNIPKRAKSVKDTWEKRCDILPFFTSNEDLNFPAIGLNVEEGPAKFFDKTRASLEYIYNHHLNGGNKTFMAFPLEWHLIPITFPGWYPKFYKEGAENCSEYPYVSHAVKPEIMYQMEYLIYRVKVWPKRRKVWNKPFKTNKVARLPSWN